MPGVSSLLRSAQAAQKKVRQQEDAFAAFDWENSAQTYDDYVRYSSHLENRAKTVGDVSENLTYQNKIRSARRSYTSNEVQRAAIAVMEGGGTLQDKQNTVLRLAEEANANGDLNLVQNLVSQYDSLSIQIQNEAERAQRSAIAAAGSVKKAASDYEKRVKQDLKTLGNMLQAKGPDAINQIFNDPQTRQAIIAENPALKQLYDQKGSIGFWDVAYGAVESIKQNYREALAQADPETALDIEAKLSDIELGLDDSAKFTIPGVGKVSAKDLQDQMEATQNGGTAYYAGVNGLEKGEKTNFGWRKDKDGKYSLATQYSEKGTNTMFGDRYNPNQRTGDSLEASLVFKRDSKGNYVDSKNKIIGRVGKNGELQDKSGKAITEEAQRNAILKESTTSYQTLLENNGFKVKGKSGGVLQLKPTEQVAGRFKELGIDSGTPVEAVVDPQGNLRFVKPNAATGQKELYQIGFDDKGLAYTQKLLEGGEGAVGADTYYDMRQGFQKYQPNTPFGGLNAGRKSLQNTSELIARGENFRYGKLAYDMEARRKFLLEQQQADALKLNSREALVTKAIQPISSAISKAVQRVTTTAATGKALQSLSAANLQATAPTPQYGKLNTTQKLVDYGKSLQQPTKKTTSNFAQKVAGFFGF